MVVPQILSSIQGEGCYPAAVAINTLLRSKWPTEQLFLVHFKVLAVSPSPVSFDIFKAVLINVADQSKCYIKYVFDEIKYIIAFSL